MKTLITAVLMALVLAPTASFAQSAFDGTWKIDTSKVQAPDKPYTVVLKDGMYDCTTCKPAVHIKADGAFHQIKGNPGTDELSITVVDDHTTKGVARNHGKAVGGDTTTISPDGMTKTVDFTSSRQDNTVTGSYTATRVAKGPAGSHATSGSWRIQKYSNMSDNALTTTYKVQGDVLHMENGTGESFSAKMDGSDAPMTGSDYTTSVAVTKMGPNSLRMVDKYQGKPVNESTVTVSADGKAMHIVSRNLKRNTTMRLVADKQ
jgi:uncharacterized GH25 family protein